MSGQVGAASPSDVRKGCDLPAFTSYLRLGLIVFEAQPLTIYKPGLPERRSHSAHQMAEPNLDHWIG